LPGFDYTSACAYFVTLCLHRRTPRLAAARNRALHLTTEGWQVADAWRWLLGHHPEALRPDVWVVMPDHLHAVLWLTEAATKPLGRYIGAFKTVSTRAVNEAGRSPGARLWQRSFHDAIVRSPAHLANVRAYIRENPARWIERRGVYRMRDDGPICDDGPISSV